MKLRIADKLELPVDAVTEAIAVLGIRRSGKSYTVRRMAEQFVKAGLQIVIVDPKGDWWGIRSSADGKAPGLPITILGGEHGDIPIEPGAGELLANLAVEETVSMLLDLSAFRKKEIPHFMTGFLETMYRLKAQERYRTPMMLIIDEADAIAPQKPYAGEERMLGAAEDIVRRGGQRGIGCTMATQRPAVLNKNVLTQCPTLIALRTTGSQDIDAIDEWIKKHGNPEKRKLLMDSIAMLPTGDAWFWNPAWPTPAGIFERAHVLAIETFDSGATPKAGAKRIEPKKVAEVDLGALRDRMAATIERQKQDDPRALRARIAELERELKKKVPAPAAAPVKVERVEVPVLKDAQIKRLEAAVTAMQRASQAAVECGGEITGILYSLSAYQERQSNPPPPPKPRVIRPEPAQSVSTRSKPSPKASSNGDLTGPEQRILDAIAWLESIGVNAPEQTAVAFLAGYTIGGGAFNNPRGSLKTKGLVAYQGNCMALTDEGQKVAHYAEAVLDTAELQRRVLERLPGPERKILQVILDRYPAWIANDEVAIAAGYTPGGGGYNNPRGRLRTLGLIEYQAGALRAKDLLFLERGAGA